MKEDLLYNIYSKKNINSFYCKRIVCGDNYTLTEDSNGNSGRCANMNIKVNPDDYSGHSELNNKVFFLS